MTPFLQFALTLVIILVAAKLGGYLATRFGQPSVLGELLIGVVLGPSVIDLINIPFFHNEVLPEAIHFLAEIGVLLLMFLAGLELHISDLRKNTKSAAYSGLLGVVVPVALGYFAGIAAGFSVQNSIFLGLTLGATSVSISAQTLMELNRLRTKVGLTMLGAAVFDDILVILLLSIVLALAEGGSAGQVAIVVLRMVLFLAGSIWFGAKVLPALSKRVAKMPVSQGALTFALVVMLVYGVASEFLGGMAAITGTFIAGLMFARTGEKSYIESGIRALSYALFVPIFFVNIGLTINLREMDTTALILLAILTVIAVVGKIIGAGSGARLGGLNWQESLQLGIGMSSRGEVGLIIASIGLKSGFLTSDLFSAVIGTVLISTLLTPPLLRWAFKEKNPPGEQPSEIGA